MTDKDFVLAQAELLRMFAEHFVEKDWTYTRKHQIKHVRYKGDFSGYNSIPQRIKRWLDDYTSIKPKGWVGITGRRIAWRHPIIHARISMRTPSNLPDGVLNEGGVTVAWEETGEYLLMVQPQVGSMIADIMEAHPELPEVQALAIKLRSIRDSLLETAREEGWLGE